MKEQIKTFGQKLKDEPVRILYYGLGLGAGYFIGKKLTVIKINIGLHECFRVKPELEPMFKEAVKAIENK